MSYRFDLHGNTIELDVTARKPKLGFSINGASVAVEEMPATDGAFRFKLDGREITGYRYAAGDDIYIRINGRHLHLKRQSEAGNAAGSGAAANEILSEMPGTVISLHAAVGQDVAEGDKLLVIESMKLQMSILAPRSGRIAKLHVAENATFDRGVPLVSFAAPEGAQSKGAKP